MEPPSRRRRKNPDPETFFDYELTDIESDNDLDHEIIPPPSNRTIVAVRTSDPTVEKPLYNSLEIVASFDKLVANPKRYHPRFDDLTEISFWIRDGVQYTFYVSFRLTERSTLLLENVSIRRDKLTSPVIHKTLLTYWSRIESEVILHGDDKDQITNWIAFIPPSFFPYFKNMGFSAQRLASNATYIINKRLNRIDELLNETPGDKVLDELNEKEVNENEVEEDKKHRQFQSALIDSVTKELELVSVSVTLEAQELIPERNADRIFYGKPPNLNWEEFRTQLSDICGHLTGKRREFSFSTTMRDIENGEANVICFVTPGLDHDRVESFCVYTLKYNRTERLSHMYIEYLCTRKDSAGNSYGRRLLESCQTLCMLYKQSALKAVISLNSVPPSVDYYARLGFEIYFVIRGGKDNQEIFGYMMRSRNLYNTPLAWENEEESDDDFDIEEKTKALVLHSD